ncbi:hypothetical protein FGG08_007090 [Glutinoglossum americanum]|uniref:ABC transporter domain-containing protein n=1 Tax=Glutinoglossum americanum TaxID=1670608 RepID=A0A9P8I632_9PEZI|nr:hypothetical protein FGG08_007090 [Glutinoglossum americanum]
MSFEGEKNHELGVCQLAEQLKRQALSTSGESNFQNPFLGVSKDPALEPVSKNFSANAWISNLTGFTSKDPKRYLRRTAGISFKNVEVYGFGSLTDYQKDVGNVALEVGAFFRWMMGTGKQKIQILRGFDGLVDHGEMLLVLGRPGSGCSTLLKTISGDTHGFFVAPESEINYKGIPAAQMHDQFRGEAIYMAETDVHFPQLTVGQTLLFAAKARAPRDYTFPGVTREMYAEHMRDVIMATFGLSHTMNTNVGNDFIKGTSGGERKRVSIAEAALSGSPLQCWDNATRGLDSANALEFCKTLRLSTELAGATACVALYHVPESIYDIFDKVTVLYEGRQIFFGSCREAKAFFTDMGFECPQRQTTADFLTSLTNPDERLIKPGYEHRTPRSPDEFVTAWENSPQYTKLIQGIDKYNKKYPIGGKSVAEFTASRRAQQAEHQRVQSPYTLSLYQQVMLCVERGFQRLRGDASLTISGIVANSLMALIIGSIFYNLQENTASFYSRSVLLFFAILLNAFASSLEILLLYAQRPIVEKHARYALYHPSAEAISSMICDMPYKIGNCISFNLVLYFMTNLRRTPSAFFVFLVFSFFTTMALSMIFRTVGASSRTLVQALCPATLINVALMVYTGFVIPPTEMVPWFRWIHYIDPIAYAYESLMINEFDGRTFECSTFVPAGTGYADVGGLNHICSTVGAVAGSSVVSGTEYIKLSFNYQSGHLWRNLGIIIAFMIFFMFTYLAATESIAAKKPKGEVLLFRRGYRETAVKRHNDIETSTKSEGRIIQGSPKEMDGAIQKQTAIFQWKDICFDIKIKKEPRRILDHVDGWVKPGTLTALFGPSGAGKTSLLDVLATRNTIGTVSGEALVDGRQRDVSFQRKTGYVQQQDIHLETTTLREALRFNAIMRQPASTSREEKLAYVEEVIELLDMGAYADAIVGVPGEGLNVEQRKKLTVGAELAAKPELLLFLDEPCSGLDSQTSWSILGLLEKLAAHGHSILCTIHQPSATLFQQFDRVLFLGPEGKPVYFGELGQGCSTITSYFERNGATPCPPEANPAEWMMEIIGCVPGSHSDIDWPEVWRGSPELAQVHRELDEMKERLRQNPTINVSGDKADYREFAAPFTVQLWECFKRVNSQYWRSPSYIYSKTALSLLTALFLGFSFYKADNTLQGLQNQTFSVFMLFFVPQILPNFVVQRSLYEARERPAKIYSWQVFMLSNILVELPWNTLMAVFIFVAWYYPIGMFRNAQPTGAVAERGGTMFLLVWAYLMFASTFAHMIQAGMELAEMAGNLANMSFLFALIFCGILVGPSALPGFWIFMYRLSPFTYLVSAVLSVGLANAPARCSDIELLHFEPVSNITCSSYMASYIQRAGGYIANPEATSDCSFCPISDTNTFLASISVDYSDRWRDFGLLWVYVTFNAAAAAVLYWLVRIPKRSIEEAKMQEQQGEPKAAMGDAEKNNRRTESMAKYDGVKASNVVIKTSSSNGFLDS